MLTDTTLQLIDAALKEDIGSGDVTTRALLEAARPAKAKIIAREDLIFCGQEIAKAVWNRVDPALIVEPVVQDGTKLPANGIALYVSGDMRSILTGERVCLNFLQRLSGIASTAARAAAKVMGTGVRILDTRKTTPGWRNLEKYAVKVGGGSNHRMGLYDAVLIKNNHIDATGGDVKAAVLKCREKAPGGIKIQVEVRNPRELTAALEAKPDSILLDNMTPDQLRAAVQQARAVLPKVDLEASGGINEQNLRAYAETGVNAVSLGYLTHSVKTADLSLRYVQGL